LHISSGMGKRGRPGYGRMARPTISRIPRRRQPSSTGRQLIDEATRTPATRTPAECVCVDTYQGTQPARGPYHHTCWPPPEPLAHHDPLPPTTHSSNPAPTLPLFASFHPFPHTLVASGDSDLKLSFLLPTLNTCASTFTSVMFNFRSRVFIFSQVNHRAISDLCIHINHAVDMWTTKLAPHPQTARARNAALR